MIGAAIGVMALRLRRDLPSLLLVFALPPLVFFVFTAVFREASTRVPDVTVGLFDAADTSTSTGLAAAVGAANGLKTRREASEGDLRAEVAAGRVDVGLIARDAAGGDAPVELIALRSRAPMAQIVSGRLAAASVAPSVSPAVMPTITIISPLHGDPVVLEEIGAVASMFLLIAAIQVAATLVDERRSGIHERVACGGDVAGLVIGKLAFGTAIGSVQAALIAATAAIVFDADVLAHPLRLVMAGVLTAAMATSFTLWVAACCSTRHQAQTICTFAILISSALGGSMVPSKLMPEQLARIGNWMPNAWSIQAFAGAFDHQRDLPASLLTSWVALTGVSILAGWLAIAAFRRAPML